MITEIFIEGKRLDADITSSLLTFALDDIKDFSSRTTQWSKTIVLPGTANNNQIFGAIYDTGLTNGYDPSLPNIGYNFNSSKSARCIIFQDNLQTFKGTLRMLEVDLDNGRIEYQVALNGEITSLSVALISGLLENLDFSEYDQAWTSANITNSWFTSTPGEGVLFPLIDYGTYSADKHNWQFGAFRPALYVRQYIDKMLTAADFRYDAPYFDTPRFKRMVVPHNQKDVQAPKSGGLFIATSSTEQLIIDHLHSLQEDNVLFTSFTGGLFSTTDNKVFTFNGASAVTGILPILLTGRFTLSTLGRVAISVVKNGDTAHPIYTDPVPLQIAGGGSSTFARGYSLPVSLNTGDTISIHFNFSSTAPSIFTEKVWVESALMQFSTPATVLAPVEYGETIQMNYAIPKNIRQIDFLTSIVKHSNLYIYEDPLDERLIHIRPFINFFEQGEDSVVDWSAKMDRNQVIKIKPMSELNSKLYKFTYTDDSDYYNDLYKKRYNQGYGSFTFDTEFEFSSNTTTVNVIFAATPLVGYSGEEKVYSTIFKKSNDTEDRTDSVIRILLSRPISGLVNSWQLLHGASVLGTYTQYGYAGHFDDPDNPGNDLNFGQLSEFFFQLATATSLDRTQFNVYYSQYMAEITDKDSKLLTARFYLTPKDIYDLRFSQFRIVDGVLYRLNKITDYNASLPDTCEVELLRVTNTNYKYPVGSTVEDDYALQWNDTEALMADDDNELLYD